MTGRMERKSVIGEEPVPRVERTCCREGCENTFTTATLKADVWCSVTCRRIAGRMP